jgi:hypothetical protein
MSDLLSRTTKLDEPRVLYVCCSASRELRGLMEYLFNGSHLLVWLPRVLYVCFPYEFIRRMTYSIQDEHFMSCDRHVLPYVCIPHDEYARQGYTSFERRVSEVGRCPCSSLTHGYRFYSER